MVSESPRSAPHLPGHAFAVLAGQQTLMLGRAERAFQPTRAAVLYCGFIGIPLAIPFAKPLAHRGFAQAQ